MAAPFTTILSGANAPRAPLQADIRSLFSEYGVPTAKGSETATQRLDRIAKELQSGRSVENLRASLGRIQNQTPIHEQRANRQAGLEYDSQLTELERQLEAVRQGTNRDVDIQQRFGQYGNNAIQNVYDKVKTALTGNNQATQGYLSNAQGAITGAYDQAQQVAQAGRDESLAALMADAQALGVGGSAVNPSGDIRSAVDQIIGNTESQKANALAQLQQMMTGYGAIGSQAVTDSELERGVQTSGFQNQVGANVQDLLFQGSQQSQDLMSRLSAALSQKGAATSTYSDKFEDMFYNRDLDTKERERQAVLDRLAEEIQRGTLNLQRDELGFNRERFMAELGLNRDRLGLDRELGLGQLNLDRELGLGQLNLTQQDLDIKRQEAESRIEALKQEIARYAPGSYEARLREAEIRQIESQIALNRKDLQSVDPGQYAGRSGVDKYAQEQGLTRYPIVISRFNNALNAARQAAASGADPIATGMAWLRKHVLDAGRGTAESYARISPHWNKMLEIAFGQF